MIQTSTSGYFEQIGKDITAEDKKEACQIKTGWEDLLLQY